MLFVIIAGIRFLLRAPESEEEMKAARMNLLYLILGAFIIFGATWILGSVLDITSVEGLSGTEKSLVGVVENKLMLFVLSLLK